MSVAGHLRLKCLIAFGAPVAASESVRTLPRNRSMNNGLRSNMSPDAHMSPRLLTPHTRRAHARAHTRTEAVRGQADPREHVYRHAHTSNIPSAKTERRFHICHPPRGNQRVETRVPQLARQCSHCSPVGAEARPAPPDAARDAQREEPRRRRLHSHWGVAHVCRTEQARGARHTAACASLQRWHAEAHRVGATGPTRPR